MRFKDWMLQNEIQLDLNKAPAVVGSPNPTQSLQATQGLARNTMTKFGTNLVQDLSTAPNPVKAGQAAVNYAQKTMSKSPTMANSIPTNPLAVGAQVYKQATGKDLKLMGKR